MTPTMVKSATAQISLVVVMEDGTIKTSTVTLSVTELKSTTSDVLQVIQLEGVTKEPMEWGISRYPSLN